MILDVNGGKLFCEVRGSGPALLLPGYASISMFDDYFRLFGNEFTVIGHDVRGEGLQTDFPSGPYTMDDVADDCAGVLDALGIEKAHYMGHSHTGELGLQFALRHPDRLDRLAVTTCGPGHGHSATANLPETANPDEMAAAETGTPEGIRRLSATALSPAAEAQKPEFIDYFVENVFTRIFTQSDEDRAHMWAAWGAFDVRDRLSQIQARTLIVGSNVDRFVNPEDPWLMWREIPRSVLIMLDGVGHSWLLEAPEMVSGLIKSFFRGELDPAYT